MDSVQEVWRGKEILSLDSRLVDLSGLITSSGEVNREQIVSFLQHLQIGSNYTGIEHVNSFCVDKRIQLLDCGFFGPLPLKTVEKCVAEYRIVLKIDMIWRTGSEDEIMTETLAELDETITIKIPQNWELPQINYVNFGSPITLDPNAIRYDLSFTLEGPPTYELDPCKFHTNVETSIGTKFYFWPGSKQMPVIRFKEVQGIGL